MSWRISLFALLLATGAARADDELATGRRLLAENRCNGACHQSHADDNDPLSLFTRANRKVNDRAALRRQVEKCVASLGSMVFPEDVEAMTAALDANFYRFKQAWSEP